MLNLQRSAASINPALRLHGDQGLAARIPGAGRAHSERKRKVASSVILPQKCLSAQGKAPPIGMTRHEAMLYNRCENPIHSGVSMAGSE